VAETVRFDKRFQGFTDGALGGYAAGVAARAIDAPAEANLRALPPLERELTLRPGNAGSVELRDGETLVLEVRPANFELQIPAPLSADGAEAANGHLAHEDGHLYPECFTCGPARAQGDGLRLFMGRPDGIDDVLASAWTPDPALTPEASLPGEFVWAALDCPTIWAAWIAEDGEIQMPQGTFTVLARQRIEQLAPVPTGEPAIVTAWPIARDGRKHTTGAAIHAPDGELLARAESLLIDVQR
jgi:hypothetical protein